MEKLEGYIVLMVGAEPTITRSSQSGQRIDIIYTLVEDESRCQRLKSQFECYVHNHDMPDITPNHHFKRYSQLVKRGYMKTSHPCISWRQ